MEENNKPERKKNSNNEIKRMKNKAIQSDEEAMASDGEGGNDWQGVTTRSTG